MGRAARVCLPLVAALGCKVSTTSTSPEEQRVRSDEIVATATVLLADGLDRELAQRAADYEARWIRACHYGATDEVRVEVFVMLEVDGSLVPYSSSTNSRASADCVSELIRHWNFGTQGVDRPASVRYELRIDRRDAEPSTPKVAMFEYEHEAPQTGVIATVTGSDVFDREIADQIVQAHAERLGACHHTGALSSEFAFTLDIEGDGSVATATLAGDRFVPTAGCVSRQMRLWWFPPTPHAVEAHVSVEISFVEPSGGAALG